MAGQTVWRLSWAFHLFSDAGKAEDCRPFWPTAIVAGPILLQRTSYRPATSVLNLRQTRQSLDLGRNKLPPPSQNNSAHLLETIRKTIRNWADPSCSVLDADWKLMAFNLLKEKPCLTSNSHLSDYLFTSNWMRPIEIFPEWIISSDSCKKFHSQQIFSAKYPIHFIVRRFHWIRYSNNILKY